MDCTQKCLSCSHRLCSTGCTTQFDHRGWAARGSYRRTVAANSSAGARESTNWTASRKRKRSIDDEELGARKHDDSDPFAWFKLTTKEWKRRKNSRLSSLKPLWKPLPETASNEVSRRKSDMHLQGR
ncbi:hypothetical protein N657DRAFT_161494 [Parathielavia appendiculata]|uniref:Uncharacterized protein n=1 Tax=Parathielavia appendiculata TaxID=2587402 RepID=A0AAN6Z011_9PEZI|nr:hypothetical protein N657DRAFT_161494 [Parathielavia appendiculata]